MTVTWCARCNTDFWQSATALGGATSDSAAQYTHDFKDATVISTIVTAKLLIVVHKNGGPARGWRQWTLLSQKTLQEWFATARGSRWWANKMASTSDGGCWTTDAGDEYLDESEPMVRNTVTAGGNNGPHTDELWVNSNTVSSNDYNRLVTRKSGDTSDQGNLGWGLGTLYDADYGECASARPQADAQMHTTIHHWGSCGGIGG